MDSKRQAEVLRAFMKDMLRKKGLQFDRDLLRGIGQEEKEFNARHKLSSPLTKAEFLAFYLDIMKELADEHFEMIKKAMERFQKAGYEAGQMRKEFVGRAPVMPSGVVE